MVAVDSFPEAQIVYNNFSGQVLILGEMPEAAYRYANFRRSEFCVYNSKTIKHLARYGKRAKIHLFFNSGMNREGIKDMERFIADNLEFLEKVNIVGLCSHLAESEEEGSELTEKQAINFFDALVSLEKHGFHPHFVHLGNSGGVFTLHDRRLTAFRTGLAFYGYNPFSIGHPQYAAADRNLRPALRLVSRIVSVQSLTPGDRVSYNGLYTANEAESSAVIPFGYYEGLNRGLSNQARFLDMRHARYVGIAGSVCMNLCCLATGKERMEIGDEVEVISWNGEADNSVYNLSKISKNIPYQTLVALRDNIRREVIWQ
jgi:alanine racemase